MPQLAPSSPGCPSLQFPPRNPGMSEHPVSIHGHEQGQTTLKSNKLSRIIRVIRVIHATHRRSLQRSPPSITKPVNPLTFLVSAFHGRHACRNSSGPRMNHQYASFHLLRYPLLDRTPGLSPPGALLVTCSISGTKHQLRCLHSKRLLDSATT